MKNKPVKRQCRNCPRYFYPVRKEQKFCTPNCRKEFHRHGGINFNKQKFWIEQEVKKQVDLRVGDLEARLADRFKKAIARRGYVPPEELARAGRPKWEDS